MITNDSSMILQHMPQIFSTAFLILSMTCFISVTSASALTFSGPAPGKPHASFNPKTKTYILQNDAIAVTWQIKTDQIMLYDIEDKTRGTHLKQTDSPIFLLSSKGRSEPISGWKIVSEPKLINVNGLKKSSSKGKRIPGKAITATLANSDTGLRIKWTAELRENANYIISSIAISSDKPVTLTRISLLNNLLAPGARQIGNNKKGAPATAGQTFFGTQVPFFNNSIGNKRLTQEFSANLSIQKGLTTSFSQVIGLFNKGQLRRDFLYYIERERSRSYAPFLHYNCWFDLERKVSDKSMLNRINSIHHELGEKRGVQVVSYVVDDGYDSYNDVTKEFWDFDKSKFPNGFTPLAKRLAEINSHLGVWLSPAGGYRGNKERRQQARNIGIDSLDLSTPVYYDWFLKKHTGFIKNAQINYFKWDKLGGGVSGHFMALMNIAQKLRTLNPELFINTTVGTWQSPFWLNQVDCTWRGGQDMGFIGKGNNREKWITYRDGITYKVIQKSDFLYPLNAMMNHGIVYANGHKFPRKTVKDVDSFSNEVRSFFGGGYALQELYLTPEILRPQDWDTIADSAKWAKKHASILIDSHFIGGDPNKLEIYGFAAWNANHGTITLRNPDDIEKQIILDIGIAFELPASAVKSYIFSSPYKDQRIRLFKAKAGTSIKIKLKPFEVLVFDATTNKKKQMTAELTP